MRDLAPQRCKQALSPLSFMGNRQPGWTNPGSHYRRWKKFPLRASHKCKTDVKAAYFTKQWCYLLTISGGLHVNSQHCVNNKTRVKFFMVIQQNDGMVPPEIKWKP